MMHFTIRIPESPDCASRTRAVFKNKFYSFRNGITGYVIYFDDSSYDVDFHLFKAVEGIWTTDPHGKDLLDNEILSSIKEAIIDMEKIRIMK